MRIFGLLYFVILKQKIVKCESNINKIRETEYVNIALRQYTLK